MHMPDVNRSPFDVRQTLPPHTDPTIEDPPYAEKLYQQINVMIFLLGGIQLGDLYGDMKKWLPEVVKQARNHWPLHRDFPKPLRDLIIVEGEKIEASMNKISGAVAFREFWESDVTSSGDPRAEIVATFHQLQKNAPYGHCFCLPFLKFQPEVRDPNLRRVPSKTMGDHIDDMKYETLIDLYTKGRKANIKLAQAVGRGINAGILSEAGPGIIKIKGGGGNNNRICDAGLSTCISRENHWCNTDANGYCTVAGG